MRSMPRALPQVQHQTGIAAFQGQAVHGGGPGQRSAALDRSVTPAYVAQNWTTLDQLDLHQPMRVVRLTAPVGAPEWPERLEEIGFWPGERVSVLARGLPGSDPLVVRVGDSTFALRRDEAACVTVEAVESMVEERRHHA